MSLDAPPPPPPPPIVPSSLLVKEGQNKTLAEQIGQSSTIIQQVAASGWYESFNDDKRFAEKSETGLTGLSNQGIHVLHDHMSSCRFLR
jgi:hypothetical protein